MEKHIKKIAIGLVGVLLMLLVILSMGYVEIESSVMYSLLLAILFVLSLIVIPKAFEKKGKKRKR